MYRIEALVEHATTCSVEIDGQYVPARPMTRGLWSRIKDAWLVLRGRADAITWPGQ